MDCTLIIDQVSKTFFPVIVLVMVGASPDQISELEGVSLVGETGNVLATYEKEDARFQDAFLIQTARGQNSTVPLPSTPFYLRLQGLDSGGNIFWRMLADLITPASTQVILMNLILMVMVMVITITILMVTITITPPGPCHCLRLSGSCSWRGVRLRVHHRQQGELSLKWCMCLL